MGVPSCLHHQHAEINSTSADSVIMTELTLSRSHFRPPPPHGSFDTGGNFVHATPSNCAIADVRIDPRVADRFWGGKQRRRGGVC